MNGKRVRVPLAVAIITKNEEDNLPDCLASVSFAAQVVVVDSGSSDGTVAIASQFGAEVHDEPWQGFGRQKQRAIDRCRQPWILLLDADERLSAELAGEIERLLLAGNFQADAYSVPRQNFFCRSWLRQAGWWPDRVVRLFRRGTARMSERLVHETLVVDGPVAPLRAPLIHHTNRNLSHTLAKINHYSSAGAEELYRAGARTTLVAAVAHALWAFGHTYLFRLGLLDGGPGLVQALSHGVNTLFKYLKLWEMCRQPGKEGA